MVRGRDINSIDDALQYLEEAAKENKEDLKNMIGDRYRHFREFLAEGTHKARSGKEQLTRAAQESRRKISDVVSRSRTQAKDSINKADEEIHKNPFPYLTGLAIASVLVGYILGSKSESPNK